MAEIGQQRIAAVHESVVWPIATEIHVAWRAGDQGKSGLVLLNVSFVACDPNPTSKRLTLSGLGRMMVMNNWSISADPI